MGSLGLLFLLYFAGNTTPPIDIEKNTSSVKEQHHEHGFSFEKYLQDAKSHLSDEKLILINQLEAQLDQSTDKSDLYDKLIAQWKSIGDSYLVAFYLMKKCDKECLEDDYTTIGGVLEMAYQQSTDTLHKHIIADEIISVYSNASNASPNSNDLKTRLASAYVNYTASTMKGVQLLLEVTRSEESHLEANTMLGRLAIVSGQYDKAIDRLERIKTSYPNSVEIHLYLAEAYEKSNNLTKAVETLEYSANLINQEDYKKEVLDHIDQLKNLLNS